MDTVLSTVPGMRGSHGEAVIEQEVSAVPGVQPVVVDLEWKRVEVTGAALDDAAIRDATVEAGSRGSLMAVSTQPTARARFDVSTPKTP